jgi:hypothetical protein
VDFLRTRAVPALIAGALAASQPAVAADCKSLDGTYRYKAEAAQEGTTDSLANLVSGPERQKLFKMETKAPASLSSSAPMQRPKVTPLADTVTLAYAPKATKLRFNDAAGKMIAEFRLDAGGPWACKGDTLQHESEQTVGANGVIRTDQSVQTLRRDGDILVFAETVTTIDPPGGKPSRGESRFKAIP